MCIRGVAEAAARKPEYLKNVFHDEKGLPYMCTIVISFETAERGP